VLLRCQIGRHAGPVSVGSSVSHRQDEFVEGDRKSQRGGLVDCELVVAAAKVLDEGVSGDDDSGAEVSLSPRIGRSRRFSWPWSASMRLLAYCSVRCQAAGASSSSTREGRLAVSLEGLPAYVPAHYSADIPSDRATSAMDSMPRRPMS